MVCAKASGPQTPARVEGVGQRRLARHRRIDCHRSAASANRRIEHHAHELVHGVEGGLLGADRGLAGNLREARRRQRHEHARQAADRVERVDDRTCNVALIDVARHELRRQRAQVEEHILVVITERSSEERRQVGCDQGGGELAVETTVCMEDGALPGDIGAGREDRLHGGAAERGHAGHIGLARVRRGDLDQIGRGRGEDETALHRERAEGSRVVAGHQGAAIDERARDRAGAGQGAAGKNDDAARARDRAVDHQRAARDCGRTGVGVLAR
jgi:hypothetical protein